MMAIVKLCGSCGKKIGPKMASRIKKPTRIRPTLALKFPTITCQVSIQRRVAGYVGASGVEGGGVGPCGRPTGTGVSTGISIIANFLPGARADQAEHTESRPGSSRPAQQS